MRSKLSLISDDYGCAGRLGPVHVAAAPEHAPPFPIDALAVVEDTHLLSSSGGDIEEPEEEIGELVALASERRPNTPGSETERMWVLRSQFPGK